MLVPDIESYVIHPKLKLLRVSSKSYT